MNTTDTLYGENNLVVIINNGYFVFGDNKLVKIYHGYFVNKQRKYILRDEKIIKSSILKRILEVC